VFVVLNKAAIKHFYYEGAMTAPHILIAVLITAMWGCNFVAAKLAMQAFPPFFLLAVRMAIVWAILAPFVPKLTIPTKQMVIVSFLLGTMHFAAMYFALHIGLDVPSAVIAGQLGVPFSCILGVWLLGDKIGIWRTLGITVSCFGVVIIAGDPHITEHIPAFIIACLAGCAWGGSNVIMKQLGKVQILPFLAKLSLYSIPQLLLLSFIIEEGQIASLSLAGAVEWSAMAYSVIASSIAAYGLWYWLLGKYDVSQVAPYSLLIPVFGIGSGQLFFNEPFTLQMQIGAFLTIAGVAVITLRKPKRLIVPR